VSVEIRSVTGVAAMEEAEALFDNAIDRRAAERFVAEEGHHLLLAYVGGTPVGMITGVETTHPDKGTEMFVYELSVDPGHRRRGIATQLVEELADVARKRGCYAMWVLTDRDTTAALATYRRAGATRDSDAVMLEWDIDDRRPDDATARAE
jgi:[ribosomal protein S18]-alanine N-acetyltransferase